jgi:hypothetical protein
MRLSNQALQLTAGRMSLRQSGEHRFSLGYYIATTVTAEHNDQSVADPTN